MVLPPPRRRRLVQLFAGEVLYGVSAAMLIMAALGVDPWDVFHQGLARRLGLGVGTWTIIVGALVLVLWIPLRQRPGLGTIGNVLIVGSVMDIVLAAVPSVHGIAVRIVVLLLGVFLNGVATGAYIGAGLGPGPRDGLTTGLAARGLSIRIVRTCIELTVLATGWILGGNVGLGTVVYALAIGPLMHIFVPLLVLRSGGTAAPPDERSSDAAARGAPRSGRRRHLLATRGRDVGDG